MNILPIRLALRECRRYLCCALIAAGISDVAAQPTPVAPTQLRPFVFRLSADLLDDSRVQVTNGVDVIASHWPALIIASYEQQTVFGRRTGTCTASLLGPNVALMAAHCVDDQGESGGKPLTPTLLVGDREMAFTCEIHPDYLKRPTRFRSPRGSEDYALCVLNDSGVRPELLKTMRFEVLDADAPLKHGDSVLMTGYGCADLHTVDGEPVYTKADGQLRLGDAAIDLATASVPDAATYATIRSRQGMEPALCPGDSGGPLLSGITSKNPDRLRRVRGVNSSVATERIPGTTPARYDFVSSVAATGTKVFRDWAEGWLRRNSASKPELCGLNVKPGDGLCRN
ncbi:MAG: hypothetical protein JWQ07_1646 [Ramlibacter sp.]|nr:hypothetical protein [Ramlibacter sp.]